MPKCLRRARFSKFLVYFFIKLFSGLVALSVAVVYTVGESVVCRCQKKRHRNNVFFFCSVLKGDLCFVPLPRKEKTRMF